MPPMPDDKLKKLEDDRMEEEEEDHEADQQPESEESHSDSDSDSDSDGESQFRVEPIVPKQPTTKRSRHIVEELVDDPSKRMKKANVSADQDEGPEEEHQEEVEEEEEEDDEEEEEEEEEEKQQQPKRKPFQRVWSDNDEIMILKGMVDYINNGRGDPYKDMSAFLDFVKKSLGFNPNLRQFKHKIRRLKIKYENNLKRASKTGGDDPVISNPHELKSYEFSKQIWGNADSNNQNDSVAVPRSKRNSSLKENNVGIHSQKLDNDSAGLEELLQFWKKNTDLSVRAGMNVERLVRLIGISKAQEFVERWKKLVKLECQLYAEKLELVRDQMKLISEAADSS